MEKDQVIQSVIATYAIPANERRHSVPVTLRTGQTCQISGNGQWLSHPHGSEGWCGIAGNGVPASGGHTVPGAAEGCLVIFRDGNVLDHFTSDAQTITITGPGALSFGCNDDNFSDNQGTITVTLDIG